MAYYIYLNEETKGPFTISTIKENLNTGIWEPSTLCCRQGENEWKPLADLFTVAFVPREKSISDIPHQLLNRTKQIALSAIKASPFKGINRPPPTPSTTNIARSRAQSGLIFPSSISAGPVNSSIPRPAPLNTPMHTPVITPTYPGGAKPQSMPTISPPQSAQSTTPVPVVIEQESPMAPLYWVLAALGCTLFVFGLIYFVIKWIYKT